MSAQEEIREKAALFGWECLPGNYREDIYLRGDQRAHVEFRRDDAVGEATLWYAPALRDGTLMHRAVGKYKKTTVISWLADVA